MADAADTLLLSLEVEAAAARNAELSQTIEMLQDEVLRLRRANASLLACDARHCPKVSLQPVETPSATADVSRDESSAAADAREVFVILDDLLFEMADIRSRIILDERVDLTPRAFDSEATVAAHARRCLEEARKLKEAFVVKQHSTAAQVSELRRALGEQAEANQKQTAASALQCAMLERKYDELKRRYDEAVSRQDELVLDGVIQSPSQMLPRS
ncbi:conserved hypothetical protein [Leishmania major strain Friedlin]|uniref:Uncharacterized protein n=1 Tax=Leishmania major TaxID=5664 RepID=Q4QA80_LEIMA|nr:conserved hypothetical protein [Leishmania major strain Friedlin]CAG9575024.1 hypothetical_protein_-_conserved [Leishmania major strain Friedlin]CAJ04451.1 conserved hypothetical protein [Leishmania major strain Friedlin]|eukprot:XP_001683768.1 conserved hypothetical protein [Leishmania major strain Friedlin]